MPIDVKEITELVRQESTFLDGVTKEVGKIIVGQTAMIERLLIGLLTGGHVLVEGVPGLAKTLMVRTICGVISAKFQRIQFTPDLLPADIVGTVVYNQQSGTFTSKKGPIFANLILADEINRAPAKVQSALLEAMQEKQVTIGDTTYPLDEPFLVMATQNPIEQEGTYPLPEAQVDRFLMKAKIDYPARDEEYEIIEKLVSSSTMDTIKVDPVIKPGKILEARKVIEKIYMDEKIRNYILDIVLATRNPQDFGMAEIADFIEYGVSPRGSLALAWASRAHAFLRHRGFVTPEDIKEIAPDVLRHRVILTYEAEAEEVTTESIVKRILEGIEVP
ncbi:MAG: MoxR family ATPase [Pseudomonadota bacterium]